jgi:Flp pilus assembly pilin Flp
MKEIAVLMWEDIVASVSLLRETIRSEQGQTLAEYSLIMTVIAIGVVIASMITFRGALSGAFTQAAECISVVSC